MGCPNACHSIPTNLPNVNPISVFSITQRCRSHRHPLKILIRSSGKRLRQCVERYGGDRSLISLADDELDGALGLIRRDRGRAVPTVAGLLMLGRESAPREHLPTHEVAFQVLEGTQVRVNDF